MDNVAVTVDDADDDDDVDDDAVDVDDVVVVVDDGNCNGNDDDAFMDFILLQLSFVVVRNHDAKRDSGTNSNVSLFVVYF